MFGAIIGDLAGSIYEFEQVKKAHSVEMQSILENDSFFSDDTILTIAILDAILSKQGYEKKLKEYGKKYERYLPNHTPYFKTTFSPRFTKWVNGDYVGTSQGNGAMMRVSPIGYLFDNEKDVLENARLATIPSHNDETAIKCAQMVALIIFYFRKGCSKDEIIKKMNLEIKEPNISKFNYTCEDTIDVCLYSLFNSTSFEDSLRFAISFGGDTDTNACIVGSMAEALYGIDKSLVDKAISKLPNEFVSVLEKGYQNIKKIKKVNR